MNELQQPSIPNSTLITPVDPQIQKYLLTLTKRTDHPVLSEMEALAHEKEFPIVGRLVGIFLENHGENCQCPARV